MIEEIDYNGHHFSIEHRDTVDDRECVESIFRKMQYNLPFGYHESICAKEYYKILARGKLPLVLDCGANIGVSPLWFRQRYPQAYIIAIEPAKSNFDLLRTNVDHRNHADIEMVHAAIGLEDGVCRVLDDPSQGMHCVTGYLLQSDRIDVQQVSLQTILDTHPDCVPFCLKVDIEGSEKELFDVKNWNLLKQFWIIAIEPHDYLFPQTETFKPFLEFHVAHKRDFVIHHENIGSIRMA